MRLLLPSVRNAKVPRPGDASPVQRVGTMVRLAYEVTVDAVVGLVDAPAFVHKTEILRSALPA